jgi:hypothetical protein
VSYETTVYTHIDADLASVDATSPKDAVDVWGDYSPLREGAEVVIQVTQGDRVIWVSLNPIQSAMLRNTLKSAESAAIKAARRERGF